MVDYFVNPVNANYFADPFVWQVGKDYYAVGTGTESKNNSKPSKFTIMRSSDLVIWEKCGWALTALDGDYYDYWAPEVAFSNGKYYLYYSVGKDHKAHQLRVAVSDNPAGPYVSIDRPLSHPDCTFAIDAHPFQDLDGKWYLFYCKDFLDSNETIRPGTAIVVDRLIDMVKLAGEERVVARATRDWQRFQSNRNMYGGIYDWHTLEGAAVLAHKGKYYCFYSGGCYQNDTYGVDYVVANSIMGPYKDDKPGQPRILRTVPGRVIGPGHNSFVIGPDGETICIVYHAWDKQMTARRMCIDKLRWTPAGPVVDGPTWTPQKM